MEDRLRAQASKFEEVLKSGYLENQEAPSDGWPVKSVFIRWQAGKALLDAQQHQMYEGIASKLTGLDVCDVGCGSGLGSLILGQEAEFVIGMDKDPACIRFAQQCFPVKNLEFVQEDVCFSSFVSRFNAVVAIEIIEHVSDYNAALVAMKKMLKKDGILLISTPNRNSPRANKDRATNPRHCREWTIDEFREILFSFFQEIEIYDSNFSQQQALDSITTPVIAICRKLL